MASKKRRRNLRTGEIEEVDQSAADVAAKAAAATADAAERSAGATIRMALDAALQPAEGNRRPREIDDDLDTIKLELRRRWL